MSNPRRSLSLLIPLLLLLVASPEATLAGPIPPQDENLIAMSNVVSMEILGLVNTVPFGTVGTLTATETATPRGWTAVVSGSLDGQVVSLAYTGSFDPVTEVGTYSGTGSFGTGALISTGSYSFTNADTSFSLAGSLMGSGFHPLTSGDSSLSYGLEAALTLGGYSGLEIETARVNAFLAYGGRSNYVEARASYGFIRDQDPDQPIGDITSWTTSLFERYRHKNGVSGSAQLDMYGTTTRRGTTIGGDLVLTIGVPEPASVVSLAVGMLGTLAFACIRKRRHGGNDSGRHSID
jgi:hypothetical protein